MEIPPIFTVTQPSEWQSAPAWMNVHYFLRAEKCPKSAALRYARYATLWEKSGYPDKPTIAALSGTVVHAAIARIARKFMETGCTSINDPLCFTVLKQLGGYSTVIAEIISEVIKSLKGNPRCALIQESTSAVLLNRIPELREQVQLQIGHISWKATVTDSKASSEKMDTYGKSRRTALREGAHFEVEVRHPGLKWRGIIDFLELGEAECVIEEFKTGSPSEDHAFQLQVYALLWCHDDESNPKACFPTRLTLRYQSGERPITVSPEDLAALETSLQIRTDNVRFSVTGPSSKAIVNAENCPRCSVRHLCSDYWSSSGVSQVTANRTEMSLDDVQLLLKERKGDKSWLAECQFSGRLPPKTSILLRWSSPSSAVLEQLKPGTTVRLCGTVHSDLQDLTIPVVSCTRNTDIIIVST